MTEGGNTGPSWAYVQNVLNHIKHQWSTQSTGIWCGQAAALPNRERQSGGEGIWGRRGLEFVLLFFQATQCWAVWATGHLGLKLSAVIWIVPRFPHCFSTWTSKMYRNTIYTWEMAAGDNCFSVLSTSNTGHKNVLKRMNLQQGTGKTSLKIFGKLIVEITVPVFSSKATRASFPRLPHFYLKVT